MTYVVTFNQNDLTDVSQLRHMSLADAQSLLALAARIPKHGRIVNVETLEIVGES